MVVTLGGAIRRLRHASGLSQRQLAGAVGIKHSYLSHIEADRREPTLRVLRQIASALDVPPSVLFSIIFLVDLPEEDQAVYETVIGHLLSLAELGDDDGNAEPNHA
jgi:transcriptional regulator with XRE-family HTH domain